MIIHIKDLTEPTALPNFISREKNPIDNSWESTCPIEQHIVEYKDQSCQTEEVTCRERKKKLLLEYHPSYERPTGKSEEQHPNKNPTSQSKNVIS